MIEILDSSISSRIISILKNGPLSALDIVKKIQSSRIQTPKQSIYLALRKLKSKEILAVNKKQIALHQTWISHMQQFFIEADHSVNTKENSLTNLKEGEYITYKFNSLVSLDMYWAHAVMVFLKNQNKEEPVLFYNPHEWFFIAREKSEYSIIKEARRREIPWLHLIGGATPLDKIVRKFFDGVHAKCHFLGDHVYPNTYYVNCFGDFVTEVQIDKQAAQEIETIYSTHDHTGTDVVKLLEALIAKDTFTHKMKISRSARKAKKIVSLFKKYFLFKQA